VPGKRVRGAFSEFAELLGAQSRQGNDIWLQEPPALAEFITSPKYLGLPKLSTHQLAAIMAGLGLDGKDLFSSANKYNEIILLWGKGAGKDYISSILISYVAYVLLCMKDPSSALGLAPAESLDIVNVATRLEQARDVFFAKLAARLRRPCFEQFRPRFKAQAIEFGGSPVRVFSLHSKEQKWEGYNIVAWVMDEADAFADETSGNAVANNVYNVLHSSAATRFPVQRWLGIIISYPRSQNGFMFQMKDHAEKYDSAYVDLATHWEVNPNFDPAHPNFIPDMEWVTVHQKYTVPIVFQDEFLLDPEGAAMRYMCIPPAVQGAFFQFPERIDDCADQLLLPLYAPQEEITTHRVRAQVLDLVNFEGLVAGEEERQFTATVLGDLLRQPDPAAQYVIHCDPGETTDSFALCMGHATNETILVQQFGGSELTYNHVVVDLLIEWRPSPNRPVDFLNVTDVLITLCELFPISKVTFDKFQSAESMQKLLSLGINAQQLSFARGQQVQMFEALKAAVYGGSIRWPAQQHERVQKQLKYLKRKNGQITHDVEAKDLADAIAAMHWTASGAGMTPLERMAAETLGAPMTGMAGRGRKGAAYSVVRQRPGRSW